MFELIVFYVLFSYFFMLPETIDLSGQNRPNTAFIVFILAPFTMPVLLGYKAKGE